MKFIRITQQILRCKVCKSFPQTSETTTTWFTGATAYSTIIFCDASHPRLETSAYYSAKKGLGAEFAQDEWNFRYGQP